MFTFSCLHVFSLKSCGNKTVHFLTHLKLFDFNWKSRGWVLLFELNFIHILQLFLKSVSVFCSTVFFFMFHLRFLGNSAVLFTSRFYSFILIIISIYQLHLLICMHAVIKQYFLFQVFCNSRSVFLVKS